MAPATKTVVAPPGTMGVSFVRQPRGHVVVGVREDSPLVGQLELGDVVKMVDGIDVSKMEAVSELIETLNANRTKDRVLTIKPPRKALSLRTLEDNRLELVEAPSDPTEPGPDDVEDAPTKATAPAGDASAPPPPPAPQMGAFGFMCCADDVETME